MKTLAFSLFLFAFISCNQPASSKPEEAHTPTSVKDTSTEVSAAASGARPPLNSLEGIKKAYSSVVSNLESNRMDSTFFSYNCQGEKKGRVVYYSDEGGLRLIQHTYDEYSHFTATDKYFIKDDSLFFVFYKHVAWSFDGQAQGQSQTIDKVTEKRFYIIENKALQCLEKNYTIRSASTENEDPEKVANKETDCTSLEVVRNKFQLLANKRIQKTNIDCLEE